jgi:hypothetical protein
MAGSKFKIKSSDMFHKVSFKKNSIDFEIMNRKLKNNENVLEIKYIFEDITRKHNKGKKWK